MQFAPPERKLKKHAELQMSIKCAHAFHANFKLYHHEYAEARRNGFEIRETVQY